MFPGVDFRQTSLMKLKVSPKFYLISLCKRLAPYLDKVGKLEKSNNFLFKIFPFTGDINQ
jgi:hypothetical protein